jgi:RNA recognition motif-containing protein
VTPQGLTEAFARFGSVARALIIQRSNDRSRHFGYVEMSIRKEAEQAVKALDGSDLLGKPIRVVLIERPRRTRDLLIKLRQTRK